MQYEYNVQQYLAIRKEKIVPIPDDCVIDSSRLCGLSNDEFVSAFRSLQETFAAMYEDAIKNPGAWGYPLETYDGPVPPEGCGAFGVKYARITEVLYALFSRGKIIDNALYVQIKDYKENIKKYSKNNLVLTKLTEFGFEISGFEKGAAEYIISFPDNENAITVLDSYIRAAAEVFDYTRPSYLVIIRGEFIGCLFYRFVEDKKYQKYDMMFHILTDTFTEEYKEMGMALYDRATTEGHSFNQWYNFVYYIVGFDNYLSLSYDFINKEIYTRIKLHNLITPEKIEMLYSLPENLQESFKNSTCSYCGGSKPGGSKCNMRIKYNWHDKPITGCAYHCFKFRNLHKDDLPYLIDLYKAEYIK